MAEPQTPAEPASSADGAAAPALRRPLCVLSSGRSGTSLAARVLNLMGVDLGPEADMLEAGAMNERGYWENRAIMSLNDAILERLGGTLFHPPQLPEGWHRAPEFEELRQRAAQFVADTFGGAERWGFKDPRTVMTLPLWLDVVGEMDYVICVRRGEEVVASTLRGLPEEDPDHLAQWWLDLDVLALERTIGRRRMFLFYEDWFADPERVARELAAFVHGGDSPLDVDTWSAIQDFFEPRLRNFRASNDERPAYELDALYDLLRSAAAQDAAGAGREAQERQHAEAVALAEGHRARMPERRRLRAALAAERAAREAADGELAEARRRVDESDAARSAAERLHASVTWAQGYIADLERWRDDLLAERDALQAQVRELTAARDAAAGRVAAAEQRVRWLELSASWRATAPLRAAKRLLRSRG